MKFNKLPLWDKEGELKSFRNIMINEVVWMTVKEAKKLGDLIELQNEIIKFRAMQLNANNIKIKRINQIIFIWYV